MALFGTRDMVRAQAPQPERFAAAFAYLDEVFRNGSPEQARLRGIAEGESNRVELSGGAFAIEQVYQTKVRADGFFESHRKYIDVQVIVEGEELMEVASLADMTARQPYNPDRDLLVYADSSAASVLRLSAGGVALFFPEDVHMPSLQAGAKSVLVRKVVVKVPVL